MSDLGDVYSKMMAERDQIPDEARYIPEDGVCWQCDRLVRGHAGVELVLALRKLKYYDEATGKMVQRTGIPYCVCK